jgi:hypothetical protein
MGRGSTRRRDNSPGGGRGTGGRPESEAWSVKKVNERNKKRRGSVEKIVARTGELLIHTSLDC